MTSIFTITTFSRPREAGHFPHEKRTWWFLATEITPRSCTYTVEPCPTPDWAKSVCHFSMG